MFKKDNKVSVIIGYGKLKGDDETVVMIGSHGENLGRTIKA